jgi:hypothetical protein
MVPDPVIGREEAGRLVTAQLAELGIPPERRLVRAERVILEWAPADHDRGDTVDRPAWLVTVADHRGYAVVAIDDRTGEVLEVRRFG